MRQTTLRFELASLPKLISEKLGLVFNIAVFYHAAVHLVTVQTLKFEIPKTKIPKSEIFYS